MEGRTPVRTADRAVESAIGSISIHIIIFIRLGLKYHSDMGYLLLEVYIFKVYWFLVYEKEDQHWATK